MSDAPLTRVQAAAVAIFAHCRGEDFDFALPQYQKLANPADGSADFRRYFEGFAAAVLAAADKVEARRTETMIRALEIYASPDSWEIETVNAGHGDNAPRLQWNGPAADRGYIGGKYGPEYARAALKE